jgi:hypothetical protein
MVGAVSASILMDGYLLTVESESTETTQCWVENGHFSASLACLQQTGELTDARQATRLVSSQMIDKITEWAEANGY